MNLYIVVAIGAAALAVAAGFWDGYRLRKEARYSPLVMTISAAGPVISLVLFVMVGGLELKVAVTVGLLALGAVTGAVVALLSRLYVVDDCRDEENHELGAEEAKVEAEAETAGLKVPAGSEIPPIRLVGASWLPLPAAFAVAVLQIASAVESVVWEALALAALEAAVAFGVVSALVLIRRRSRFNQLPRDPAAAPCLETPAAAA